jgi:hypothetical protein
VTASGEYEEVYVRNSCGRLIISYNGELQVKRHVTREFHLAHRRPLPPVRAQSGTRVVHRKSYYK